MDPYLAGQTLGSLFGAKDRAYSAEMDRQQKIEAAKAEARYKRAQAVLAEGNVSQRGVMNDPALVGRFLAGDTDARNEYLTAATLANPNVDIKTLGEGLQVLYRQAARDKAVLGDADNPNAELFGVANGPVETTKISDGVAYSPLGSSSQSLNVTPLGEAAIGQRNASAASSYASANNSNASAARTRQGMGIDAAKFGLQRGGQWNPGGKAAGGTLGDSSKPLPVGALKELLAVEDALGGTQVLGDIISKNQGRLRSGEVDVGPGARLLGGIRTSLNLAGQNDVNLSELNADKTKIVNESLRLNKGVQTEGDAQRAGQELMAANDRQTLLRAFDRLSEINARAVQLQQQKQNLINSNYGRTSTLGEPPAARGPGLPVQGGPAPGTVRNGYRFRGGNPADRNAWEKI